MEVKSIINLDFWHSAIIEKLIKLCNFFWNFVAFFGALSKVGLQC